MTQVLLVIAVVAVLLYLSDVWSDKQLNAHDDCLHPSRRPKRVVHHVCPECGQVFLTRTTLQQHEVDFH